MAGCSSCPSASGCQHAAQHGGDGACDNPFAQQDRIITGVMARIKHKIFVMSGKGGVGKSSVTVNTAAALAKKGFRVGILDVDLHGPSIPNLLGLKSTIQADADTGLLIPAARDGNLSVISMDALLQDKDQAILWRGPKKASAIRQFMADVKWGDLDFLFIDSPPGTGDEHMTVLKSIPDAQCVVVTTPQEISLADVRKAINFLQYVDAAILGIVENMSGLFCPNCGEEIDIFKKGGGRKLAETLGLRFLGAIPLDPAAVVAADVGEPVVFLEKDGPAKKAFLELAEAIVRASDECLASPESCHNKKPRAE